MVLRQPLRPIEGMRGFLAAGERELDAALGVIAARLEARQHIHPDGIHGLHVGDTASVEIAVLLDEGERIARPVRPLGLDHVQMAEQEHGLGFRRGAVQHRHQAAFPGMLGHREQGDIGIGKARRLQVRRHALGRERAAAHGERGIGLHQLFVEGEESHLVGAQRRQRRLVGAGAAREGRSSEQQQRQEHEPRQQNRQRKVFHAAIVT